MQQNIPISNKCSSFELSIHHQVLKQIYNSIKNSALPLQEY